MSMPGRLFFPLWITLIFTLAKPGPIYGNSDETDQPQKIPPTMAEEIRHHSWHPGCPVAIEDLVLLTPRYYDFNQQTQVGELIVHASIAAQTQAEFERLYKNKFPIARMRRIDHYYRENLTPLEADDASMADNNTSAFNCRRVAGKKQFSNHASGLAIDINPGLNPYFDRGQIKPAQAKKYLNRQILHPGMLINLPSNPKEVGAVLADFNVIPVFGTGWSWGANPTIKESERDFQHLDADVQAPYYTHQIELPPPQKKPSEPTQNSDVITITAVGDLMLGSTWPRNGKVKFPTNPNALLEAAKPLLRRGDVVFGNVEGVLTNKENTPKKRKEFESYWVFRMPTEFAKIFRSVGFNLVSIGNNHTGDFGETGELSTMNALDLVGIHYSGSLLKSPLWGLLKAKGKTIGLLAFASETYTPDITDLSQAQNLVRELKANADIVIVSFHGGTEGPGNERVPYGEEIFEGQSRGNLREFSHAVISAGADLVIGHSPHVPRGMEIFNDRLIAYSLGNFATFGWIELNRTQGLSPLLEIKLNLDGSFAGGKIHSFYQEMPGGPKLDPQQRAAHLMRDLSQQDFTISQRGYPASPLVIEDDGKLRKKPTPKP